MGGEIGAGIRKMKNRDRSRGFVLDELIAVHGSGTLFGIEINRIVNIGNAGLRQVFVLFVMFFVIDR